MFVESISVLMETEETSLWGRSFTLCRRKPSVGRKHFNGTRELPSGRKAFQLKGSLPAGIDLQWEGSFSVKGSFLVGSPLCPWDTQNTTMDKLYIKSGRLIIQKCNNSDKLWVFKWVISYKTQYLVISLGLTT